MYFLLADLLHRFVHLKTGRAAVLVFVGLKMLRIDVVKVPIALSPAVIATRVTVSVIASLRATRGVRRLTPPPRRTTMPASRLDDLPATAAVPDQLDAADVALLVQTRSWPCVSILLPTTPADRMTAADVTELQSLYDRAVHELDDLGAGNVHLRFKLETAVHDASLSPMAHGLAVFVSQGVQRIFRLPSEPASRVVIEPTFATRDLVETLHRTPPHLLLLLTPLSASLFRGYADTLVPVEVGFPRHHRLTAPVALNAGDDGVDRFLTEVDQALGPAREQYPGPILVAGSAPSVASLLRRGRNLQRLAGVLPESVAHSVPDLQQAVRLSLQEYLRSREEEALLVLEDALAQRRASVALGIEACWTQARSGRPKTLLVEEGFRFPALVSGQSVHGVDPARVRLPGSGDLRQDLVDDLIEVVIERGGWVAFTRDGALDAHHRVALIAD